MIAKVMLKLIYLINFIEFYDLLPIGILQKNSSLFKSNVFLLGRNQSKVRVS
jgi:hypothetical protein